MSASISPHPPSPPRSFWRRRLLDPLVRQLTQGITPEKLALSLALGVTLGLFPVIGTTSLLCLLAAWIFRLNQPVIQAVNQLLWPVHVAFILPCIRLGERVLRAPHQSLQLSHLHHEFWASPREFFRHFGSTIGHATVGWLLLSPLIGVLIYALSLPVLRRVHDLYVTSREPAPTA